MNDIDPETQYERMKLHAEVLEREIIATLHQHQRIKNMNIYATAVTLRTVCRTCGEIHNEVVTFEEPVLVSELELHAHETIDEAGYADGQCPKCDNVPVFGEPEGGWGSSTQPEEPQ